MRTISSMSLLSCLCLALLLSQGFAPSRAHRLSRKLQQDSSNWSPWSGGNPWYRPPQQGNSPGNSPWGWIPPGCQGEVHPGNPSSYSYHCGQGSSGSSTSPPSRSIPVPAVPGGSTGFPPSPPSPPSGSNGGQFPPRANPIPPGCRGTYHAGNPSWWSYSCDGDNGGYSPPSNPGSSTPSSPGYGSGIDFPGIQYLPPWLRDWLRHPTTPFPHPPFGN